VLYVLREKVKSLKAKVGKAKGRKGKRLKAKSFVRS
jgi:hypothetical protein